MFSKRCQSHQVIGIDNISFILRGDVEIIKLHISFSKTDQYGHGSSIEISETKSKICPVLLIKKYLLQRPNLKGPIFCHFGGKPVTRYQFSAVLNKVLKSLGIGNSAGFRTHSFRIGAATSHFEKGTSEQEIQMRGCWKSCAYKGYCRA